MGEGAGGRKPEGEAAGADEDDILPEEGHPAGESGRTGGPTLEAEEGGTEAFWKDWVRFQGLAVLLWLPWAVPFIIQVLDVGSGFWLPPPWPNLVLDTFRNFHFAFLPSHLPVRPVLMWGYTFLAALGLIGLLFRLGWPPRAWRRRQTAGQADSHRFGERVTPALDSERAGIVIVCLFLVPHIVALVVSLRSPIYAERPLIWTTLPYFMLVSAGIRIFGGPLTSGVMSVLSLRRGPDLAELVSTLRFGALILLVAAIPGLSGLSLNGYYFWFQKEAWDEAASHIAEQVRPGEMIVFNATWVQIPFAYYLRTIRSRHRIEGVAGGPV